MERASAIVGEFDDDWLVSTRLCLSILGQLYVSSQGTAVSRQFAERPSTLWIHTRPDKADRKTHNCKMCCLFGHMLAA